MPLCWWTHHGFAQDALMYKPSSCSTSFSPKPNGSESISDQHYADGYDRNALRFLKTCTPVGTLREVAPTVVAAMHAEYVFLRMSGSTIMCTTQYLVNIEHRLAARSGAQVKRHKTFQNRRGAGYAAASVLPLALLGMWRRSLGDRSAIQGQRWLRQLASLHFQNRHLWTDLAP